MTNGQQTAEISLYNHAFISELTVSYPVAIQLFWYIISIRMDNLLKINKVLLLHSRNSIGIFSIPNHILISNYWTHLFVLLIDMCVAHMLEKISMSLS